MSSTCPQPQLHEDDGLSRNLPPARVRVRRPLEPTTPDTPAVAPSVQPVDESAALASEARDIAPGATSRVEPSAKGAPAGEYEVGYGKPPKHTQFKPGNRANPKGRPKGTESLVHITGRVLDARVPIREHGRTRSVSYREALILQRREAALRGDHKAFEQLMKLDPAMKEAMQEQEAKSASAELSLEDQALVLSYLHRRAPKPEPEQ